MKTTISDGAPSIDASKHVANTGPVTLRRVTLFSDAIYFGGAEMYLYLLARRLHGVRCSIDAVLPPDAGADRLRGMLEGLGLRVHTLPRAGFAWARSLGATRRVLEACAGEVLHLNLPSSYDAGLSSVAFAARAAGYHRVVSTEHLPMIDRKLRRFPVKLLFSHWVDRIIVMTEENREFLIRRHGMEPEKIAIVENGVEELPRLEDGERARLRAEWGAGPTDFVVGSIGALTRRKGQHTLLRAAAELASTTEGERLKVVLVGEGEERGALEQLVSELGLTTRTCFSGARQDAARIVAAFDLFVLASQMESMPLTVLEAMAASVPTVATSVYGLRQVVQDDVTGRLVPADDPGALAAALRSAISQPEQARAWGRAGRMRWEARFTAQQMAERTADLYLESAAPTHPSALEESPR